MNVLRPWLNLFARRALPQLDARALSRIWEEYDRLRADGLPRQPTLGARLVVRLSALTLAAYRALRRSGLDEAAARRQTAALTWAFYRPAAQLLWRLAGLLSSDPLRQVQRAMRWSRRFPYNPPGYRMEDRRADEQVYAFDVLRCPAADYLRAQGAGALCRSAWCELDDRLAKLWGLRLERSGLLAEGAPRCDFHFSRPPQP